MLVKQKLFLWILLTLLLFKCSSCEEETVEEKSFYQILGVDRSATLGEIKRAYRDLAKQYHPDMHKGNEEMNQYFGKINQAYEVLSDETKRSEYDMQTSSFYEENVEAEKVPEGSVFTPFTQFFKSAQDTLQHNSETKFYRKSTVDALGIGSSRFRNVTFGLLLLFVLKIFFSGDRRTKGQVPVRKPSAPSHVKKPTRIKLKEPTTPTTSTLPNGSRSVLGEKKNIGERLFESPTFPNMPKNQQNCDTTNYQLKKSPFAFGIDDQTSQSVAEAKVSPVNIFSVHFFNPSVRKIAFLIPSIQFPQGRKIFESTACKFADDRNVFVWLDAKVHQKWIDFFDFEFKLQENGLFEQPIVIVITTSQPCGQHYRGEFNVERLSIWFDRLINGEIRLKDFKQQYPLTDADRQIPRV